MISEIASLTCCVRLACAQSPQEWGRQEGGKGEGGSHWNRLVEQAMLMANLHFQILSYSFIVLCLYFSNTSGSHGELSAPYRWQESEQTCTGTLLQLQDAAALSAAAHLRILVM